MQWTAGRPDGMTRRPDGWLGTKFSDLQTVQNLLETLLNSGIPVKKHRYNEVILSNRMRQLQTNIELKRICISIYHIYFKQGKFNNFTLLGYYYIFSPSINYHTC
jgi:hypothetical protein